MDMACRFGETSEATRLKVGSLLYKNDNIIALGTNGTRSGWRTNQCEDSEGKTTAATRHAEIACLDKLRKSTETSIGAILVVSHCPCLACSVELVEAGVEKVFYRHDYRSTEGIEYLKLHGIPTLKI
jgi:dCMP deaminase